MHMQIITAVKPYLIKNGRPTGVVKKLQETQTGRELINAMFAYYASQVSSKIDCDGWVLTHVDIENYRYENFFVDRLRKAGL